MAENPLSFLNQNIDLRDQLLKDPRTLAEKLLKRPAVTCSLTIPVQKHTTSGTHCIVTTIPFYMDQDFSFSLGNKFRSLQDQMDAGSAFTDLLNNVNFMREKTQVSMQSELMSTLVWTGSTFDGFNINCLFIATNRNINPVDIIKMISAACLPRKLEKGDTTTGTEVLDMLKNGANTVVDMAQNLGSTIINFASEHGLSNADIYKNNLKDIAGKVKTGVNDIGMTAPLQYGIDWNENNDAQASKTKPLPNTTLTLQIGDYFLADELVVDSISNITFSKELIAPRTNFTQGSKDIYKIPNDGNLDGFPLYATCSLSLKPCSMMTYDKFYGYFIKKQSNKIFDTIQKLGSFKLP